MSKPSCFEEMARCDREIAAARAELLAGHPDIQGLLLCMVDWAEERRLIEDELPFDAA